MSFTAIVAVFFVVAVHMLVNKYADELPYIPAYLIKSAAVTRYNSSRNLSLAQCLYGTSLKVERFWHAT